MSEPAAPAVLQLADYRRRVAEVYAGVRREQTNPELAWQRWVQARDNLFRTHPQSALEAGQREAFHGLQYFPYDPQLRLIVDPVPIAGPPREVQLEQDGLFTMKPVSRLSFELSGQLVALTLFWISGYGGGLFLPFRDLSNGKSTYGGGRYLLDTIKGADLGTEQDRLVVDFNFAYNPSCAYSPQWSCPLAPHENWLPVPVHAGELDFNRLP